MSFIKLVFAAYFINRILILVGGVLPWVFLHRSRDQGYMNIDWPRSLRFLFSTCFGRGSSEIFSSAQSSRNEVCRRLVGLLGGQYMIELVLIVLMIAGMLFLLGMPA